MKGTNNTNVFTPEQRAIIMQALNDPEKKKAIIAILEDAERRLELHRQSLQVSQ